MSDGKREKRGGDVIDGAPRSREMRGLPARGAAGRAGEIVALFAAFCLFLFAGQAGANGKTQGAIDVDAQARRIYHQLMSPFCPGQTLYNCRSSQAEMLRHQIRERLARGEAPEAIIATLVEQYGEGIRGAPRNRGLGRLAWIAPAVILLLGGIAVFSYLRRHVARPGAAAPVSAPADSELRSRVEKELESHRP